MQCIVEGDGLVGVHCGELVCALYRELESMKSQYPPCMYNFILFLLVCPDCYLFCPYGI